MGCAEGFRGGESELSLLGWASIILDDWSQVLGSPFGYGGKVYRAHYLDVDYTGGFICRDVQTKMKLDISKSFRGNLKREFRQSKHRLKSLTNARVFPKNVDIPS